MAKRTHKGMDAMPPSGAKSRKGHGGARDGAGRRAVLNEDQRSWIGAYYQNSWEKLTRGLARLRQQSDANRYAIRTQGDAGKGALSQLQSTQRSLRKLTVHERRGGWAKNWRNQAEDLIEATGGRYILCSLHQTAPKLSPGAVAHRCVDGEQAIWRADAASAIGVGKSTLHELIATGKLSVRKLGRRSLVLREDLEKYLQSLPVHGEQGAA
jgi:excisionase family DNA binding protein